MVHWGMCPSTYNSLFISVFFDLYKVSDSDYMLIVASCKHPVTFVALQAPNPSEATVHDY